MKVSEIRYLIAEGKSDDEINEILTRARENDERLEVDKQFWGMVAGGGRCNYCSRM